MEMIIGVSIVVVPVVLAFWVKEWSARRAVKKKAEEEIQDAVRLNSARQQAAPAAPPPQPRAGYLQSAQLNYSSAVMVTGSVFVNSADWRGFVTAPVNGQFLYPNARVDTFQMPKEIVLQKFPNCEEEKPPLTKEEKERQLIF
jgi:hypothetical protein